MSENYKMEIEDPSMWENKGPLIEALNWSKVPSQQGSNVRINIKESQEHEENR